MKNLVENGNYHSKNKHFYRFDRFRSSFVEKQTFSLTARLQRGLLDLILDSRNHHVHLLRQSRIASGHESFDPAHCFSADRSY